MDCLAQLDKKVAAVVAAGSVGQPVFVRLTAALQLEAQAAPCSRPGQRQGVHESGRATGSVQSNIIQPQPAQSQLAATDPAHLLASLIEKASQWLAQPVHTIRAVQRTQSEYLSAIVTFARGATAIVSLTSRAGSEAAVDLILLGNRGGVYFEQLGNADWPAIRLEPNSGESTNQLCAALRSSLQTGTPVLVRE